MATTESTSRWVFFAAVLAAIPRSAASAPPILTGEQIAAFSGEQVAVAAVSAEPRPWPDGLVPGTAHQSPGADDRNHCSLDDVGSDQATSESCTRCHVHRQSHPYDIDYASAAAGHRGEYAQAEQVVRAGVLLPNGEIRCVTCHDRRSPWKYKIALPPGATPSPSVAARMRDGTFERPGSAPARPAPGSEVTPTPLCKVCHQF